MKGFGITAHGAVEEVDGAPVVTTFMAVGTLPLIPIVSWYASDVAREDGALHRLTGLQEDDIIGVRRRLHGRSVLFGYLRGLLATGALVLGLVLFVEVLDQWPMFRTPDRAIAVGVGLVTSLALLGLSVPLGRRPRPRDVAIRRALAPVLGVPGDLARIDPLDVPRWRNAIGHSAGARDWETIVAGRGPADAGRVTEALAQVRLELATGKLPAVELERCTDALLERLATAPAAPARSGPRAPTYEDDDGRELDSLPDDLPGLAACLGQDDERSLDALDALKARGPEAIPVLVELLDDRDRRYDAQDLLAALGAAAAPAVVAALVDEPRRLAAQMTLEQLGAPAAPALIEAVRGGEKALAEAALDVLRDLEPAAARGALEPAVERALRGELSWFAVTSTFEDREPSALFDAIRRGLDAARDATEALDALLQLDRPRGIGVVLELARAAAASDPEAATDPHWHCEALDGLAGLGATTPAGPLLAAAGEPIPAIRVAVLEALAWIDDPAARAAVERAAREDPVQDVREAAEAALERRP